MKFCPKCGTLMIAKTINGRRVLVCPKCGYIEEAHGNPTVQSVRSTQIKSRSRTVVIVEGSVNVPPTATLIKGEVRCPKCGHDEVYAWQIQTRAADEPATTFYRCAKCGHTWREY